MKGDNSLHLCQSQMVEIVQFYLERVLFQEHHCPQVTGVDYDRNGGIFEVSLTEREEDDNDPAVYSKN